MSFQPRATSQVPPHLVTRLSQVLRAGLAIEAPKRARELDEQKEWKRWEENAKEADERRARHKVILKQRRGDKLTDVEKTLLLRATRKDREDAKASVWQPWHDSTPDQRSERAPSQDHPSWYSPMLGEHQQAKRQANGKWPTPESLLEPTNFEKRKFKYEQGELPLGNPKDLARESAKPLDARRAWWGTLYNWHKHKLDIEAERYLKDHPNPDDARRLREPTWIRSVKERHRRASYQARKQYHKWFPDDPPSDPSDSDDDMQEDKLRQDKALLAAQAARVQEQKRKVSGF